MPERLTLETVKYILNDLNRYSIGWRIVKNFSSGKVEYSIFRYDEYRFSGTLKEVSIYLKGLIEGYSKESYYIDENIPLNGQKFISNREIKHKYKEVPLNIKNIINKEEINYRYREFPYEFTFIVKKTALNDLYSFTSTYHVSIFNIERNGNDVFFTLNVRISKLGNLKGKPERIVFIRIPVNELDITDMSKTVSRVLYYTDVSLRGSCSYSNDLEHATFIARLSMNENADKEYVNLSNLLAPTYIGMRTKSVKITDINVLEQKTYEC